MSKQTTLSLVAWGRAAPLWGAAAPHLPLQQTLTPSALAQAISRATKFRPARSGADSARKAEGKKEGGRGAGKTSSARGGPREARRALGARWARAGARRVQGNSSRARRSVQGRCSAGDLGHVQHSRAGGRQAPGGRAIAPWQVVRARILTAGRLQGGCSALPGRSAAGFGAANAPWGRVVARSGGQGSSGATSRASDRGDHRPLVASHGPSRETSTSCSDPPCAAPHSLSVWT